MKSKELKKRLKTEMQYDNPDLLEKIVKSSYVEKPIPKPNKNKKIIMARRLVPAVLSCCLIISLCVTGAVLYFKKSPVVSNASYITMEVYKSGYAGASASSDDVENPVIAVTADSNNQIDSIRADNAEGTIVLDSLETELLGKPLEDGIKLIAEGMAKTGYFDLSATAETADTIFNITVSSTKNTNDILNTVTDAAKGYFKKSGIYVAVQGNAFTQEKLVEIIKQFDQSIKISDGISVLNKKLAERQSYIDEEIVQLSVDFGNEISIAKIFLNTIYQTLEELKLALSELALPEEYIISGQEDINNVQLILSRFINGNIEELNYLISAIELPLDLLKNELSEGLSKIGLNISGYVTRFPDTSNELKDFIMNVNARHSKERIKKYSFEFEKTREEISENAYNDFLNKFN